MSPSSASLRDDLVREAVLAVELLGDRRDPLLGELAHGLAQEGRARRRGQVHYYDEAAGQLGEEPHAVAGGAEPRSNRRGRARGRTCRRCRGAPTGPRRRTPAGRRRRGWGRPAGSRTSSSGRRKRSRCNARSARGAGDAMIAARVRGASWISATHSSSVPKRPGVQVAHGDDDPAGQRGGSRSGCVAPDSRAYQSASARIRRPSASVCSRSRSSCRSWT